VGWERGELRNESDDGANTSRNSRHQETKGTLLKGGRKGGRKQGRKEGRKKERKKERKEGRKEGGKEGRNKATEDAAGCCTRCSKLPTGQAPFCRSERHDMV
jgi:hypothetical protein